jgi:superfamily II helicase
MFLITCTHIRTADCGCCPKFAEEKVNKLVSTIEQVKEIKAQFAKEFNIRNYTIDIIELNEIDLNNIVNNFKEDLLESQYGERPSVSVEDIEEHFESFSRRSKINSGKYGKQIDERNV